MRLPSLTTIDTALAERSLSQFVRQAWAVLEPATDFVHGWHIDVICEHLEAVTNGQIKNLIINIPPGCMKSLLTSVMWPVWDWIAHPHRRYLTASYAQSLSTRDALKSRRLIQSEWYQQRWGDRFSLTSDQNQKTRYENDKAGFRVALSVGGAVTTYTYGVDGAVTKVDTGDYAVTFDVDTAGTWWCGFYSTGTGKAASDDYRVDVQPSKRT